MRLRAGWRSFLGGLGAFCAELRSSEPRYKYVAESPPGLAFEELEARHMLAGDVLAVVGDGNLFLRGDELANHIVVEQTGSVAGEVRISSGSDKTTINGQDGPLVFSGVTGQIRAVLNGGNDTLQIKNVTTTKDVRLDGGEGDNSFEIIEMNVGRHLLIHNKAGLDEITIHDSSAAGNLEIR